MNELKFKSQDKILIVAPHPDDEIIGCGGLILSYPKQCDVLLLTDGSKGHRLWSPSRTARIRKREFESVMKKCNVSHYVSLGFNDRTLSRIVNCYHGQNLDKYDYVFVPNKCETHTDHRASFYQLVLNRFISCSRYKVFQYEVWSPLSNPTHILDITSCMNNKLEVLELYQSQINELNYIGAVKGLNQYRGLLNHFSFAECYREGVL
ncbi:N-acetylglucosaminyl deacetylase, LmbE family [Butyrivibrio proteoclasticus]|uniref:N-acetylglucosaminyl deacetylase, LmbE family n=1 Tax=Butyrivibrio proteoclasticus TaxID=43305 RepID=A0A1I5VVD5_9FIRM|nr:PIG-L family deacetylase [Butyrivibrio proteoclasticus]SFQ11435.1 N-acetylglucosaminyl deacetylase, LmbE family [Butyrivibrio proteoclasticus]